MPSSGGDPHLPRHMHRFHRPLGARKLASPQIMRAETCPRTKQARRRADGTAGRAQRLDGADHDGGPRNDDDWKLSRSRTCWRDTTCLAWD